MEAGLMEQGAFGVCDQARGMGTEASGRMAAVRGRSFRLQLGQEGCISCELGSNAASGPRTHELNLHFSEPTGTS